MVLKAKFKCDEVCSRGEGMTVELSPVTGGSEENEKFFKYTPFGILKMGLLNNSFRFDPDAEYYVEITRCQS